MHCTAIAIAIAIAIAQNISIFQLSEIHFYYDVLSTVF